MDVSVKDPLTRRQARSALTAQTRPVLRLRLRALRRVVHPVGWDKPAGRSCPNLGADFGCGIHDSLRERSFPGCAVFDCFGAGQQVIQ